VKDFSPQEELSEIKMTDEELIAAVDGVKRKTLAWDCIPSWLPRLLIRHTPRELLKLTRTSFGKNTTEE